MAVELLKDRWGIQVTPDIDVEVPKQGSHGDISTTIAMGLAKTLKRPPRKIAEEIVGAIKTGKIPPAPPLSKGEEESMNLEKGGIGIFEKIEIAGPGFINFTFKTAHIHEKLRGLLEEGHFLHLTDIGKGRKVQIEFVSANPTGPVHIGHGRGAAVGNALSNLLQAAGFDVHREFYINDAGLQVRLLGLSVYTRYQQAGGGEIPFPEDGYQGDYIRSVSEEIERQEGKRYLNRPFEECGDFFTGFAYKMMLDDIEKDLKDFGITFDSWQSEKELYEKGMVKDSLETLRKKGFLYERDGALWFRSTAFRDDKDRVVVKKDGEYTYFASDIAYHKDKLDRGFDAIIDIWGADHHGYVPRLRAVLEAYGLPHEKFTVILIQMVTLLRHGVPVQMSKRSGKFITLREVIDEVGTDTAKFIFLTRRADSHLEFDIEIAKAQSAENPVFYIQYAFARISSIFRQAEEKRLQWFEGSRVQEINLSVLKESEDISLIKKILQYPMVLEGAALSFEPHRITYYLQELAGTFHSYYNKYRVLSEDQGLSSARLCLCRAVQITLEDALRILGVRAPERM